MSVDIRRHNRLTPQFPHTSGGGFTLLELMVVLMILAILLAIIVPSYLGARERSQDRAAQVNLDHALTAVKVAYSDYGSYGPLARDGSSGFVDSFAESLALSEARLRAVEPRIDWMNGLEVYGFFGYGLIAYASNASTAPHRVSFAVRVSDDERRHDQVLLAALSDTGVCWIVFDDDEEGTYYGHIDLDGLNDADFDWSSYLSPGYDDLPSPLDSACNAGALLLGTTRAEQGWWQSGPATVARIVDGHPDVPWPPTVPSAGRENEWRKLWTCVAYAGHTLETLNDHHSDSISDYFSQVPRSRCQTRPLCLYERGWRPIYRTGSGAARYACPPSDPLPRT